MKYIVLLFSLQFSLNAFPQFDKPITKGNFSLGGNIGFGYDKDIAENQIIENGTGELINVFYELKTLSFNLNPSFGYFIVDGLLVGLSPTYSYYRYNSSGKISSSNTIGIDPLVKFYFKNSFFVALMTGYSFSVDKYTSNKLTENSIHFTPSVGYAIFINSKVSIEPSLNYKFERSFGKSDSVSFNSDSKNHNIFFYLGFHIFL